MTSANFIITREHIIIIGIMLADFITVKSLDTHVWFLLTDTTIVILDSESSLGSDLNFLSGSLKPWKRGWELYKTRKGKAGGVMCLYRSPDQNYILNAKEEFNYDWNTSRNWLSPVLSGGHSYFLLRFWLHHSQPRIWRRYRLKNESLNAFALQIRKK